MAKPPMGKHQGSWILLLIFVLITPSLGDAYGDYGDYGDYDADVTAEADISASISAEAEISADVTVEAEISASISAEAEISADVSVEAEVSASISAEADISAGISASADISAGISASADISAGISASADISADADISASVSVDGEFHAEGDISASISADISASISADISASISADVSAHGSIDADASLDISASASVEGEIKRCERPFGLGSIRGLVYEVSGEEVEAFLGIRYAEAPVGGLRFQLPVPISGSGHVGVLEATDLQPACYQYSEFQYPWANEDDVMSEDCLHLNIYTPRAVASTEKLPVMFYIHGGFFHLGSNRKDIHDGRALAAIGDAVVVTINYRLGALGYLYSDKEEHRAPGNLGLYDVLTALKWVHENIHHFNGDKDLITIFGNDAGSIVTGLFLVSPLTEGLFRRAIMQSQSPVYLPFKNKETNHNLSKKLAEKLHCHNKGHYHHHNEFGAGFKAGNDGFGYGNDGFDYGDDGLGYETKRTKRSPAEGNRGFGPGAGRPRRPGAGYGAGGAGYGAGGPGYYNGDGSASVDVSISGEVSASYSAALSASVSGEFGGSFTEDVSASVSEFFEGSASERIKESVSFSDSESASFVVFEADDVLGENDNATDFYVTEHWVDCLRNLDPLDIVKAQDEFTYVDLQNFSPHYGDEFVIEHPRDSFLNLNFHEGVDLFIGNTADEGSNLVTAYPKGLKDYGFYGEIAGIHGLKAYDVGTLINRHFKINFDAGKEALKFYKNKADDGDKPYTAVGDYLMTCPNVYTAERFAEKESNNVYYYLFNHQSTHHAYHVTSPNAYAYWQGVAHGEEIQYIFGQPHRYPLNYTLTELTFSTNVVDMFATFARTGVPRPDYPKYNKRQPYFEYLVSDIVGSIDRGPHKNNCEFLRDHFGFDIIQNEARQVFEQVLHGGAKVSFTGEVEGETKIKDEGFTAYREDLHHYGTRGFQKGLKI